MSIYDTQLPYRLIVVETDGRVLISDRKTNQELEDSVREFSWLGYGCVSTVYGKKTIKTMIMVKNTK